MNKLTPLFNPHSIAVIGASRTEGKVGNSGISADPLPGSVVMVVEKGIVDGVPQMEK